MPSAEPVTDHRRIREWAEEHGGRSARVKGTNILRIDLPADGRDANLEPISWDEWFRIFDESGLALLIQEEKEDGEPSTFNKLVSRESAQAKR